MTKRMVEVIIIVSVLFLSIYFLLYHLYFNKICSTNSGFIWDNQITTTIYMWKCQDKIICSIDDIQYDKEKINVTAWQCKKNSYDYFEPTYYKNKIYNLLK